MITGGAFICLNCGWTHHDSKVIRDHVMNTCPRKGMGPPPTENQQILAKLDKIIELLEKLEECPDCKGSGQHYKEEFLIDACPECGGKGKIP